MARFDGTGIVSFQALVSKGLPWQKADLRSMRNPTGKSQLPEEK
jgi:hypothetical protein